MKIIIGCLILFLGLSSKAQVNRNLVKLSGHLKNFPNREWVRSDSEISDLQLPEADGERELIVDDSGYFSIQFNLTKANYYRIGSNALYLSPGDSMVLEIDYKSPLKATFRGMGSQANLYLKKTPFPQSGSYIDGGLNIKSTIKESIDYILLLSENRASELKAVKHLDKEFRKLETARIQADLINSFKYLAGVFIKNNKIQGAGVNDTLKEFNQFLQPLFKKNTSNFLNVDFLKLDAYRSNISRILYYNSQESAMKDKLIDWENANGIFSEMSKMNDRNAIKEFFPRIEKIQDSVYRSTLKESYYSMLKFGIGDLAHDFISRDINGKEISLNSFKGKLIVLDVWATWCVPCLQQMPYFDALREKYKDHPNIAFISLSIDDNKAKWSKKVLADQLKGTQLIIEKEKMKDYRISGIPRTIIIDENYKIFELFGPRPSDKELKAIIEQKISSLQRL